MANDDRNILDNILLKTNSVLLTGVKDELGSHLFTIQTHSLFTQLDSTTLVQSFHDILTYYHSSAVSLLINCSLMTLTTVEHFLEVLCQVQKLLLKCSIKRLYIVRPTQKSLQASLKKELKRKQFNFQVVIVKHFEDLTQHIKLKNLASDFGGFLLPEYNTWAKVQKLLCEYYRVVDILVKNAHTLTQELQSIGYELGGRKTTENANALNEQLKKVESRKNKLLRKYNLTKALEDGQRFRSYFQEPSRDEDFYTLSKTHLFQWDRIKFNCFYRKVLKIQSLVETSWKDCTEKWKNDANEQLLYNSLSECNAWIVQTGLPYLMKTPGRSLVSGDNEEEQKVEDEFRKQAKKNLKTARRALKEAESYKRSYKTTNSSFHALANNLSSLTENFEEKLNERIKHCGKRNTFMDVVEKAETWYAKAQEFWPQALGPSSHHYNINLAPSSLTDIDQSEYRLEYFLKQYPLVTNTERQLLMNPPDDVTDLKLRHHAWVLGNRCQETEKILRARETHILESSYEEDWELDSLESSYQSESVVLNASSNSSIRPRNIHHASTNEFRYPSTNHRQPSTNHRQPSTNHRQQPRSHYVPANPPQSRYRSENLGHRNNRTNLKTTTLSNQGTYGPRFHASGASLARSRELGENKSPKGKSRLENIQRRLKDQELLYEQLIIEEELRELNGSDGDKLECSLAGGQVLKLSAVASSMGSPLTYETSPELTSSPANQYHAGRDDWHLASAASCSPNSTKTFAPQQCMQNYPTLHEISTDQDMQKSRQLEAYWTTVKTEQRFLLQQCIPDTSQRKEIEGVYFNAQVQLCRLRRRIGTLDTSRKAGGRSASVVTPKKSGGDIGMVVPKRGGNVGMVTHTSADVTANYDTTGGESDVMVLDGVFSTSNVVGNGRPKVEVDLREQRLDSTGENVPRGSPVSAFKGRQQDDGDVASSQESSDEFDDQEVEELMVLKSDSSSGMHSQDDLKESLQEEQQNLEEALRLEKEGLARQREQLLNDQQRIKEWESTKSLPEGVDRDDNINPRVRKLEQNSDVMGHGKDSEDEAQADIEQELRKILKEQSLVDEQEYLATAGTYEESEPMPAPPGFEQMVPDEILDVDMLAESEDVEMLNQMIDDLMVNGGKYHSVSDEVEENGLYHGEAKVAESYGSVESDDGGQGKHTTVGGKNDIQGTLEDNKGNYGITGNRRDDQGANNGTKVLGGATKNQMSGTYEDNKGDYGTLEDSKGNYGITGDRRDDQCGNNGSKLLGGTTKNQMSGTYEDNKGDYGTIEDNKGNYGITGDRRDDQGGNNGTMLLGVVTKNGVSGTHEDNRGDYGTIEDTSDDHVEAEDKLCTFRDKIKFWHAVEDGAIDHGTVMDIKGAPGTLEERKGEASTIKETLGKHGGFVDTDASYGTPRETKGDQGTSRDTEDDGGTFRDTKDDHGTLRSAKDNHGPLTNSGDDCGTFRDTKDDHGTARSTKDNHGPLIKSEDDCGTFRDTKDDHGTVRSTKDNHGPLTNSGDNFGAFRDTKDDHGTLRSTVDSHGTLGDNVGAFRDTKDDPGTVRSTKENHGSLTNSGDNFVAFRDAKDEHGILRSTGDSHGTLGDNVGAFRDTKSKNGDTSAAPYTVEYNEGDDGTFRGQEGDRSTFGDTKDDHSTPGNTKNGHGTCGDKKGDQGTFMNTRDDHGTFRDRDVHRRNQKDTETSSIDVDFDFDFGGNVISDNGLSLIDLLRATDDDDVGDSEGHVWQNGTPGTIGDNQLTQSGKTDNRDKELDREVEVITRDSESRTSENDDAEVTGDNGDRIDINFDVDLTEGGQFSAEDDDLSLMDLLREQNDSDESLGGDEITGESEEEVEIKPVYSTESTSFNSAAGNQAGFASRDLSSERKSDEIRRSCGFSVRTGGAGVEMTNGVHDRDGGYDGDSDEDFGVVLEDIAEEEGSEYEDLTYAYLTKDNKVEDGVVRGSTPTRFTGDVTGNVQEMDANFASSVIIDAGSGYCKAGFSVDEKPRIVFPSVVGQPLYQNRGHFKDHYVGNDVTDLQQSLTSHHPIKNGCIYDWDLMEKLLDYTYEELRCESEQYPVLLSEPALNSKINREQIMQMMFESFHVPAAYICVQAVLALFATGKTTGLVYDCGHDTAHCVPIYEGYALPHATTSVPLAGHELTIWLGRMLQDHGVSLSAEKTTEFDIVQSIKEKLCYVVMDYDSERKAYYSGERRDNPFMLPDGQTVSVGSERFRCPEILFNPSMVGLSHDGLHEVIYKCVMKCDMDMRSTLLNNIVLSGGSAMFTGLPRRLHLELSKLYGSPDLVKIEDIQDGDILTWQGGAMLSKLPNFNTMWITSEEYEEFGPSIVHKKCV